MLSPTLVELTKEILKMCQSQFPRTCGNCGRNFPSFKSYVEIVEPLDVPKVDNIEDEDPIGLMSFGNCPCGSTLTIRCVALGKNAAEKHQRFNEVLRQEQITSNRSTRDILIELRGIVREAAVSEK